MMEGSQAEKDAKARRDWEGMREAFTEFQKEFHATSNDAKNASLYVDWKDGDFVSPSEQITDEMLAKIIERNQTFLGYAQNSLNMLRRLISRPKICRAWSLTSSIRQRSRAWKCPTIRLQPEISLSDNS
jgi:hypothetical protein